MLNKRKEKIGGIEWTLEWMLKDIETNGHYQVDCYPDVVRNALKTIRERQEVVRCADCIYFEPSNEEEGDTFGSCRNDNSPCKNQRTDMVWFCADGEMNEQ